MADQFWIIQAGKNPSTDFFIKPELQNTEVSQYHCFEPPPSLPPKAGLSIIFVRYLSKAWLRWVERYRNLIDQLIYFMDDDLFDMATHRGLSTVYRWKLYYNACRYKSWLQAQGAQLWLSTPWLVDKYQSWQPKLLEAKSPYIDSRELKTIFYHGSSSHMDEINWLLPVVRNVLNQDSSLVFEMMGNHKVRKIFSDIPRVNILHPMGWESYQALVSRPGRSIGLAPLLNTGFNQARSYTKYYDITQAGAVGVYADHNVYRQVIRHKQNGFLVPMEPQLWVNAILELSNDVTECERMLKNSRNCL
ncbi:glycosyltransferase family 1 protein [uncultured Amphritea sp.]|uniref:glycosyltransferase n=1 Tax=uncultured Amphritea sp. TaxID=981605 RepID=UPI002608BC76|nr:glycosyltransferase family 1 protein [uncultured Amphritea sp.]